MELTDLSHDDQMALAALFEAIAMTDGVVTEGEEAEIGKIAAIIGETAYRSLLDEADSIIQCQDDLKKKLLMIEDQDVRNLIYGTVLAEAIAAPSIDHTKSEMLNWLKMVWNIEERVF